MPKASFLGFKECYSVIFYQLMPKNLNPPTQLRPFSNPEISHLDLSLKRYSLHSLVKRLDSPYLSEIPDLLGNSFGQLQVMTVSASL